MDGNTKENLNSNSERMLDALLEDYMTPPKDLAQRICVSCMAERKLEEEFLNLSAAGVYIPRQRRRGINNVFCRIAAAFILVGSVLALAYKGGKQGASNSAIASQHAAEVSPAKANSSDETVAEMYAEVSAPIDFTQGFSLQDSLALTSRNTLSEQNLMAVSTDGAIQHAKRHRKLSPVANEITHVWLTKDENDIRQFITGDSADIEKSFTPDENGVITLGISAEDTSIQALVDELYNSGRWKLLSSASPQPNQGNYTPLDGHHVNYTLRIVK